MLLGTSGLGLISDIRIQELKAATGDGMEQADAAYRVKFQPVQNCRADNEYFDFLELSFGTRRVVQLLVSLIFDKSSVMLIEHPEEGIHPGLMYKVISLLQTYAGPGQLILTSHSPEVLSQIAPDNVRLVSMTLGETEARPLSRAQLRAAKKFLKEDGPLAEFLGIVQEV